MKRFEIAGYIPFGLHNFIGTPNTITSKIIELSNSCTVYHFLFSSGVGGNCLIDDVKPVLHPFSDINKTFIINGKKEIPIVECAKMTISPTKDGGEWKLTNDLSCINAHGFNEWVFDYKKEYGGFTLFCNGLSIPIENQYKMFDYLNSRFIDYRNLIGRGDAIDVNTLEINPYNHYFP